MRLFYQPTMGATMAILIDISGSIFSQIYLELSKGKARTIQPEYVRHTVFKAVGQFNNQFKREYGDCIVCCDHGSWRKKAFELYKWERHNSDKDSHVDWDQVMAAVRMIIQEMHQFSTFRIVDAAGAEGDDCISVIARILGRTERVMIVSSDKDMVYLTANPNIKQYSPFKKDFYTVDDPMLFEFDLIMRGDKSDGVPNIKCPDDFYYDKVINARNGIKTKNAPYIATKWVNEIWETIGKDKNNIMLAKEAGLMDDEQIERFNRNKMLISLDSVPDHIVQAIVDSYKAWQPKSIMELMQFFSLHRMNNLSQNIELFQPQPRFF